MREKIIYGVLVRLKSESKLMKFFGWISKPFNSTFMTDYWTTFFGKVYAPSSFNIDDEASYINYKLLLDHENVHIQDQKKFSVLFYLTYIFPPAILAYGRYYWERKAYLVELKELSESTIDLNILDTRIEEIVNELGGPAYFFAWPKFLIRSWFKKQLNGKI